MNILAKLLPAKAPITSDSIRAEIASVESEIANHRAKLTSAMDGIATMTDAEHIQAEADIASTKRAIARLEAKIARLDTELPNTIAKEEAAAKVAADATLVKRAKASAKANEHDAKGLLKSYAEHAEAIADILAKLKDMDAEREAVNAALRANPVADGVVGYNQIHRKHPDRQASEQREMAPHWIYKDAPTQPGEVHIGDIETAIRATIDANGNPVRHGGVHYDRFGRPIQPQLERREVVTAKTAFRAGNYEFPLSTIHLPPAFAGGNAHWPRS